MIRAVTSMSRLTVEPSGSHSSAEAGWRVLPSPRRLGRVYSGRRVTVYLLPRCSNSRVTKVSVSGEAKSLRRPSPPRISPLASPYRA